MSKETLSFVTPLAAEKLQNFFGVFLQFHIGVDTDYLTTCALGKGIVRVEGLDDLLSELKAQGRNLNQLTTLANMGRITILRGDDLFSEYTRLCDLLGALVLKVR